MTEVPATAQWQGQQHLLYLSASVVAAEPHPANPTLLVVQSRWGPW